MSNLNLNSVTSLGTGREVDVNRVMQTVDYVGGLVIDSLDTVIVDGDDRYVLASSTVLPYTTTGAGMPEGGAFVSVGDAVLRQDLAAAGGARLVGNGGIIFDSVSDMVAATWLTIGQKVSTLGYYTPGDGGGNDYEIVAAATGTDDGGSFIDLNGSGLQAKGLFVDGVVHVRQFGAVGDGITNDSANIQNAINSTMGVVLLGVGSYLLNETLVLRSGISIIGNSATHGLLGSELKGGANPLISISGTSVCTKILLERFALTGDLANTGIKCGSSVAAHMSDSVFRFIEVGSCNVGLDMSYCWDNTFDSVRVQNNNMPFDFHGQVNSCCFINCSFVSFNTPGIFSNCEGLHFVTPDISNFTTSGYGFSLHQSSVTMDNPYIEAASDTIALIGFESEQFNSTLAINGGIISSGSFVIGKDGTNFEAVNFRTPSTSGERLVTVDCVNNLQNIWSNCSLVGHHDSYTQNKIDLFLYTHSKSYIPDGAYGGSQLTSSLHRGFVSLNQSATNNGVTLSSNLTVGEQYTLELMVRKDVDVSVFGLRSGDATSAPIAQIPLVTEGWVMRRIHFLATNSTLRLLFDGTIQVKLIRLSSGFVTSAVEPVLNSLSVIRHAPSQPTLDTWFLGDIVLNSTPSVGAPKGWVCTQTGTPGVWVSTGNL